jgi:5'(3')-deoxyribonucleotidase
MRIFVDMDDVLADTYGKHIEWYNREYQADLSLAAISYGEVWQNVPELHQDSIRRHVLTEGFFSELEPISNSQPVMEALSQKHEVYIATAASQFPKSLKEKSDWLDRYFPFISWHYRIYCGHKFMLHGDLLIDDRSYNLKDFSGDTLLFSSPHNRNDTGFKRVDNWLEIADLYL